MEVTEVVGVEGGRVIFERCRPPRDTVFGDLIHLRNVNCFQMSNRPNSTEVDSAPGHP